MPMHNVDDLLNQNLRSEEPEPVTTLSQPEVVETLAQDELVESVEPEKMSYLDKFRKDKDEFLGKKEPDSTEKVQSVDEASEKPESSDQVDDYGTEVAKSKTYTEVEVQEMIRKRLKLHHEDKQQQQVQQPQYNLQQQQANQDFQPDSANEEPWEVQLRNNIRQTVQEIEHEKQQQHWQREAQVKQAEFETKFTHGMQRYSDFHNVVAGKPITDGIMMAARGMNDPAAFIYAASKQHSKELERISQINDPYLLAAEVGRLEERMRKAKTVSSAPKPVSRAKGDITGKDNDRRSIDDLIRIDAKRKISRR